MGNCGSWLGFFPGVIDETLPVSEAVEWLQSFGLLVASP